MPAFTAELLAFYGDDAGPAANGYTLDAILEWGDDDWDEQHDFIQWLFPTDEPSRFNSDAPVLDAATAAAFSACALRRHRLRQSFDRWLTFCGIARRDTGLTFDGPPRREVWGRPNHNWMRVSRVLRSLRLLGLPAEAAAFFTLLATIRPTIDADTWRHWEAAAAG